MMDGLALSTARHRKVSTRFHCLNSVLLFFDHAQNTESFYARDSKLDLVALRRWKKRDEMWSLVAFIFFQIRTRMIFLNTHAHKTPTNSNWDFNTDHSRWQFNSNFIFEIDARSIYSFFPFLFRWLKKRFNSFFNSPIKRGHRSNYLFISILSCFENSTNSVVLTFFLLLETRFSFFESRTFPVLFLLVLPWWRYLLSSIDFHTHASILYICVQ